MKGMVYMSPRTGRPPKHGTSRTGNSLHLSLTEDEANAIQSLAKYFNLSRTDVIVGSIRYLQARIEQNDYEIETYLAREQEEYCEVAIERLQMAYEDNILQELELFEEQEWEYFMEETLPLLEEQALENEEDFYRDEAIEDFKLNALPELLEKEKKEIEHRYEEDIEKEAEEEWEESGKYEALQYYFELNT